MAYVFGPLNTAFTVEVGAKLDIPNTKPFAKVGIVHFFSAAGMRPQAIAKVVPGRVDPARRYNFSSPRGVNGYGSGPQDIPSYGQIWPRGR